MDKNELIKIAVTAIISVTAKEILTGLIALVKKYFGGAFKSALIKIFTPYTIEIYSDAFSLLITLWVLIKIVADDKPLTRLAVFGIAFMTCMVFAWGYNLLLAVFNWRRSRLIPPRAS